jgi:YidC/Oxa1 family membrane protein insertase
MERRAIIALLLSFVVFLVFMYVGGKTRLTGPKTPAEKVAKPEAPPAPKPETPPSVAERPAPPPRAAVRPAREVVVNTPLYKAVFSEQGASLKSFQLKKFLQSMPFKILFDFSLGPVSFDVERYQDPAKSEVRLKDLVRTAPTQEQPLSLSWEGKQLKIPPRLFYEASQTELNLKADATGEVSFTAVTPEGVVLTRTYTFNAQNYGIDLSDTMDNRSSQALKGQLDLTLTAGEDLSRKGYLTFTGSVDNRVKTIKQGKIEELETFTGRIDWAGLDKGYFLLAMAPKAVAKSAVTVAESRRPTLFTSAPRT